MYNNNNYNNENKGASMNSNVKYGKEINEELDLKEFEVEKFNIKDELKSLDDEISFLNNMIKKENDKELKNLKQDLIEYKESVIRMKCRLSLVEKEERLNSKLKKIDLIMKNKEIILCTEKDFYSYEGGPDGINKMKNLQIFINAVDFIYLDAKNKIKLNKVYGLEKPEEINIIKVLEETMFDLKHKYKLMGKIKDKKYINLGNKEEVNLVNDYVKEAIGFVNLYIDIIDI